jgi:hypothetical protein
MNDSRLYIIKRRKQKFRILHKTLLSGTLFIFLLFIAETRMKKV